MTARRKPRRNRSPGQDEGRPALENGRRNLASTKLSDAERDACVGAAQREGKTLSQWIRDALLLRAAAHGE